MSGWEKVRGHDVHVERFRMAIQKNRLASTFLFTGPAGIGKRLFARCLAQSVLCEQRSPEQFDFCGTCASCLQVAAGTHLDVIEINKPEDKNKIPIELLIGERGHRMHEGLCHAVSMRPASGKRKVAIISDADDLNEEGANALLKTLEEPPASSIVILIGTSAQKQLPTIRSRCQMIRFQPLTESDVVAILVEQELAADIGQAQQAARFAGGSLESARFWFAEENYRFRSDWLQILCAAELRTEHATARVTELLQESGKDNWKKRAALRLVAQVSIDFFQTLMKSLVGMSVDGDDLMIESVRSAQQGRSISALQAAASMARCEQALHEIAANANPNLLVDSWMGDLARLSRGEWVSEPAS